MTAAQHTHTHTNTHNVHNTRECTTHHLLVEADGGKGEVAAARFFCDGQVPQLHGLLQLEQLCALVLVLCENNNISS